MLAGMLPAHWSDYSDHGPPKEDAVERCCMKLWIDYTVVRKRFWSFPDRRNYHTEVEVDPLSTGITTVSLTEDFSTGICLLNVHLHSSDRPLGWIDVRLPHKMDEIQKWFIQLQ